MTKFTIRSYPAEYSAGAVGNASIHITSAGPMPPQQIEAKNTAEALVAVEKYAAEAALLNVPLVVAIGLGRGERSPNGFKAAANKFWYVNVKEPG